MVVGGGGGGENRSIYQNEAHVYKIRSTFIV